MTKLGGKVCAGPHYEEITHVGPPITVCLCARARALAHTRRFVIGGPQQQRLVIFLQTFTSKCGRRLL